MSWVGPEVSSRSDVPDTPPQGGAREASSPDVEPPQLAPLHVEEQRLYSESLLMSELLTLSLRLSPDTLQRKLISAACIRDLKFYFQVFCNTA